MESIDEFLKKIRELNSNKKYDETVKLLPKELLEKYNDSYLYSEKAEALWRLNNHEESNSLAEKAINLDSKNAKGWNYIGNYLSETGHKTKSESKLIRAKNAYNEAIEIDKNYVAPYNGLGRIYFDLKDYKKSEEYYQKAVEIDPEYLFAYHGLGIIYSNNYDFEKAKSYFLKAQELDPNYAKSYNFLGWLYDKLNEPEKAEDYFLKALDINPKLCYSYNGLGSIYKQKHKYEEAESYFIKSLELDSSQDTPLYNLGQIYFDKGNYNESKIKFEQYLSVNHENDFYRQNALSKIKEIDKIIENSSYKRINGIVDELKELLKFTGKNVTHYTGISTVQFLVLRKSPFRLSEGSFLNDTSEGQELFSFLDYTIEDTENAKCNKETFTKSPFIGSFVDSKKNNDLTLWRMYGKEGLEEAKGCSITLDSKEIVSEIKKKLETKPGISISNVDDIEFYRVAYRDDNKFNFANSTSKQRKSLNELMKNLKSIIDEFKADKEKDYTEEVEIIELLNQIAYLFKSIEYQYENEIRLIIKEAIGFERKIDYNEDSFIPSKFPNKVYIELVPVYDLLKTITIGPKVDKGEEWASTFYYHLANQDLFPEIHISTLPFK